MFVSLITVSGTSIIKCFKPSRVVINNKVYKKILVGIIDSIGIDNVDVILNNNLGGLDD